jgi:dienelactone hydrolase
VRNNIGRSHPVVRDFFSQLRKEEGTNLAVGVAGFCWGGKHAVLLAQGAEVDGRPLIDAAFAGHPSWLDIPGDIEKLTKPVAFAIGDRDSQVSVEQADQIKAVVEALPDGVKGEVRVYKNCGHGFCIRADVSSKDSEIAEQAVEAENQCIAWFERQFNSLS